MKKKLFFFGIVQSVIILLIYLLLVFIKEDYVLIFTFIYSFFLSFNILKNKTQNFFFNDTTVIILIFLFLYGFFNPIVEFVLQGSLSKVTYFATIIYASCIPAFILGIALAFKTKNRYNISYLALVNPNIKKSKNYNIFLISILGLLLSYVSFDFYSQGILFNPSVALKTNRLELFTEISQFKIVVGLFISSIFLYFIYYFTTLSIRVKSVVIFLLCYFVLMELSVGNRRDFVPMIIGFFWIFVKIKKINFTFRRFIYLLLGLFFFLFLGSIRSSATTDEAFNFSNLALSTLASNEFIYPFYTLGHYVDKFLNGTHVFLYGLSIFLYPILFFIPRDIYPEKPISLAVQFIKEIDSTMGYAYSPVTELFVNFGVIGPFVGFLIIGIIIFKMQSFKDQRFNFVFFTMIPDFCRGEIGTFIYQFFFISFFIILLPNLLKNISKGKNSNLN
jgi:oligosaccharide repeat unit polymerase